MLWSLLPLVVAGSGVFALGWFYWEAAVDATHEALGQWELVDALQRWLDTIGAAGLHSAIAPLLIVALAVPAIVVLTLLLVAWFMTPALVGLVVARRFPALERQGSSGLWWEGVARSLVAALAACAALVLTAPLWLVPPLALVLPALIWGWLTAQVLGFDALAWHATRDERRSLLRRLRWPLLGMGVVAGLMGSAPSLLWALGGVAGLIVAPLLVVVAIWLYTLVFAFAALWFAHFTLAELHALRLQAADTPLPDKAARTLPAHPVDTALPRLP